MAGPKPAAAADAFAGLIGEYGWDHDVLYIREKDGKLNALIEWFFEYPLERASRDVYRFPRCGSVRRPGDRLHGAALTGGLPMRWRRPSPFKRRPLPTDDERTSFHITPVAPIADAPRQPRWPLSHRRRRVTFLPSDLVELTTLDPTHQARHPLRDDEQLPGHAALQLGAAPSCSGPRRRRSSRAHRALKRAGLRPAGPRRLSAVVRDQDVLGRDAARAASLRRRPVAGLAAQPRLRRRPDALRPEDRPGRSRWPAATTR